MWSKSSSEQGQLQRQLRVTPASSAAGSGARSRVAVPQHSGPLPRQPAGLVFPGTCSGVSAAAISTLAPSCQILPCPSVLTRYLCSHLVFRELQLLVGYSLLPSLLRGAAPAASASSSASRGSSSTFLPWTRRRSLMLEQRGRGRISWSTAWLSGRIGKSPDKGLGRLSARSSS